MKTISPPPVKVPRLNSLLHRLQKKKTPSPDDEPYLDQLMLFLEEPPQDVTDRWKAGAEMCAAWGVATSGPAVYRLFQSYRLEWSARVALNLDDGEIESDEILAQKIARLILLRTAGMLANPGTPAAAVVGLIRADLRQKHLEFARQRHSDRERTETERALVNLEARAFPKPYTRFCFAELKAALDGKPPPSAFQTLFPNLVPLAEALSSASSAYLEEEEETPKMP